VGTYVIEECLSCLIDGLAPQFMYSLVTECGIIYSGQCDEKCPLRALFQTVRCQRTPTRGDVRCFHSKNRSVALHVDWRHVQ
jgi:hypothetical protein